MNLVSFKDFLQTNSNYDIIEFKTIFADKINKLPDHYKSSKYIINLFDINSQNKKTLFKKVYSEMYFKDTLLFLN